MSEADRYLTELEEQNARAAKQRALCDELRQRIAVVRSALEKIEAGKGKPRKLARVALAKLNGEAR